MIWLYLLLATGIAIAAYSLTFARWRWSVQCSEAAVLPKGAKPIRVLHISDIHMAPWQRGKQRFIKQLISLQPDLIVNTGDNLGHTEAIEPTLSALGPLLDVPGVFVNGSNDYYAPRFKSPIGYVFKPSTPHRETPLATAALTDTFESLGWKNLNNRGAAINVNGTEISFIGVDDAHDQLADLDSLAISRKKLKSDFVIGVTHAPYRAVIEAMAEQHAEIIFAGHTHGGQVRFPFIGALTTNCDLPNKYAKGMSAWQFDGRVLLLNVCAGLGNSIFAPIRWFNLPEVRLVTLVSKN
jgi:predicted MPP superfamily phosphohydrolase